MEKMKPCPWCKDTVGLEIQIRKCDCGQHNWVFVKCIRCGATGPHIMYGNRDDRDNREREAIRIWNSQ